MPELFDYMTLKLMVWALVGILLIAFALTDGFDLGIGAIFPFVAKTDDERRIVLNTIGPIWEGQQVWFIAAGTLLFASWPIAYATSFTVFYWVLFLLLWTLFLRPVCFDYRSKMPSARWRNTWDWVLCVASLVPPIVFGAAFGNLLLGVPFHFNEFMQSFYTGTVLQQFHPFAVLCGLVSLMMLVMHGAHYLLMRTEGLIATRARSIANVTALVYIVLFLIGGYVIMHHIEGYRVIQLPGSIHDVLIPVGKTVDKQVGLWMLNYEMYPWTRAFPIAAVGAALAGIIFTRLRWGLVAFLMSGITVACTILTAAASMFPFIFPSSSVPANSLTVWDATAGKTTLATITLVNLVVLPIIIVYVSWVYRKLSGKVTVEQIRQEDKTLY